MKIREHVYAADACIFCGAMSWAKVRAMVVLRGQADPGTSDPRTCREREDHIDDLRPEPARRQFASEDWDTIGARLVELEKERRPVEAAPSMDYGDCCG